MAKKVMLISFHYPPVQGSSGVHRTVAFSRYLREYGWHPTIMTVNKIAYEKVDDKNSSLHNQDTKVIRAFALNARKHFSIGGKYLGFLEIPDPWQSWIVFGVIRGVWDILRNDRQLIFSTYPIASAHVIGLVLKKLTRRPWIAEFRDPMVQGDYPAEPRKKSVFSYIERSVFANANRIVVVSPGAKEYYMRKYPQMTPENINVVENGYDQSIRTPEMSEAGHASSNEIILIHSGVMYPRERDPSAFFAALSAIRRDDRSMLEDVRVVFRASGSQEVYRQMIAEQEIRDLVEFKDPIDYRSAFSELLNSDILILCQGELCNGQIPAKAYEYLFTRKPILALCDPQGDTGRLLKEVGCPYVAKLEDPVAIRSAILRLIHDYRSGSCWQPSSEIVQRYSRVKGANKLALVMDSVCADRDS